MSTFTVRAHRPDPRYANERARTTRRCITCNSMFETMQSRYRSLEDQCDDCRLRAHLVEAFTLRPGELEFMLHLWRTDRALFLEFYTMLQESEQEMLRKVA